jgi:hypothetical protein
MVTIMETNEMKQKNEEILARWRGLGFLKGLKEGSINEWRCAKSFDNLANYMLNCEDIKSVSLEEFAFPFVRRVLCTGKKRLYRILTAEEVCDFLTSVTVRECVEYVRKRIKTELGKAMLKIIDNYLEYADRFMTASNASLVDFCDDLKYNKTNAGGLFYALMKDVFDFEAELLSAATDIFVDKSSVR